MPTVQSIPSVDVAESIFVLTRGELRPPSSMSKVPFWLVCAMTSGAKTPKLAVIVYTRGLGTITGPALDQATPSVEVA